MGRRSIAELEDLTGRIIEMYDRDKLTIAKIAEALRADGVKISRESVRRSLKSSKELAADLRKTTEEARVLIDAVRENPNTDIAEAVTVRFAGLLLRESQEIDSLEFADPGEAVLAASRLANAQAKLGSVRMKYQNGYEAAKKEVLAALKRELRSEHPDILERLTMIVGGLEAGAA